MQMSARCSPSCTQGRESSLVTREALEMRLGAVLGTGPTLPQVLAFCEYILDLPPLRSTAARGTDFPVAGRSLSPNQSTSAPCAQ